MSTVERFAPRPGSLPQLVRQGLHQTLHQVRFDLLRTRWSMLAFAVAMTMAAFVALDLRHVPGNAMAFLPPLFVTLTAMFAVAMTVLQDAPFADAGFHVGKPIPVIVLVGAKLLLALLLMMVAAMAAVSVLHVIGISTGEAMIMVTRSVGFLACWLAFAFVFGIVTPDLRHAPLTMVGVAVCTLAGIAILSMVSAGGAGDRFVRLIRESTWWILALGVPALLVLVYRRRITRPMAIGTAAVGCVWCFMGLLAFDGSALAVRPESLPVVAAAGETLSVERIGSDSVAEPMVVLHLEHTMPDARYEMRRARLHVRYADGDSLEAALPEGMFRASGLVYDTLGVIRGPSPIVLRAVLRPDPELDRARVIQSATVNAELVRLRARPMVAYDDRTRDFHGQPGHALQVRWQPGFRGVFADVLTWSQIELPGIPEHFRWGNSPLKRVQLLVQRSPEAPIESIETLPSGGWNGAWLLMGMTRSGWSAPLAEEHRLPDDARLRVVEWIPEGRLPVSAAYRRGTP